MRRSFRWVLGVGAVFAAAECVMGQVGVSPGNTVDPNPPAIPQSATGLTTTFAIQYFANVAGLDKRIFFSCAGSGGITTTGCPAAQFLTSGAAPTTVTVTFSSGAAGAGWLTIRADTVTPVGAAATTGRRDFAVVSPAASLIALAPTASTMYRGVGSAGAESYVLTNTGQLTSTYTIASVAASCTGVLTGCVIAPSSTPALAPNGPSSST